MLVAKYKSRADLELHRGEVLLCEGSERPDPNGRVVVMGPALLDRRFRAEVELRDGKIARVR